MSRHYLVPSPPQAPAQVQGVCCCRAEAVRQVRVPKSVIAMIADLRSHLQENLEPPVYVSDRRLVKAIAMLQVRRCTPVLSPVLPLIVQVTAFIVTAF